MTDHLTVQLIDLQPDFLRNDPSTIALCNAFQPLLALLGAAANSQRIYTDIDNLDGDTLDDIAWGLGCTWYAPTDTLSARRATVKGALRAFSKMGTVSAVREVLAINFGDSEVQEWFDYGGAPGCFKVYVEDPSATHTQAVRFAKTVDSVKNVRSKLEAVILQTTANAPVRIAMTTMILCNIGGGSHG